MSTFNIEFEQSNETVNYKGVKVNVVVWYHPTQEYLPFIQIRGMRNLHHVEPKDWDAVYGLADNWIDLGYWRSMTFAEFCERIFPDENLSTECSSQ